MIAVRIMLLLVGLSIGWLGCGFFISSSKAPQSHTDWSVLPKPERSLRPVPSLAPLFQELEWLETASWEEVAHRWTAEDDVANHFLFTRRLVALDPLRTWAICESERDQTSALYHWMRQDLNEALDFITAQDHHEVLIDNALVYAGSEDFTRWRPVFKERGLSLPALRAKRKLIYHLARSNPHAAADQAIEMGLDLSPILSQWMKADAEAVMHWTDQLHGSHQDTALKVLTRVRPQNWDLLAPRLKDHPHLLSRVVNDLVETGADANLLLRSVSQDVASEASRRLVRESLFQALAHHQPERLAQLWTQERFSHPGAQDLGREFLHSWMETDPHTAQRWVLALKPGEQKDQLLSHLLFNLKRSDPQSMRKVFEEAVNQNPALRDQEPHLLGFQSSEHAARWLTRYPVSKRAEALQTLAGARATEPEIVASVLEKVKPGSSRRAAAAKMITRLAAKDPAKAAQWIQVHAAENEREILWRNLTDKWIGINPLAAADALEPMLLHEVDALESWVLLARGLTTEAPDRAVDAAMRIDSDSIRQNVLSEVLTNLAARDPNLALARLQEAALPDEAHQQLATEIREQAAIKAYLTRSR